MTIQQVRERLAGHTQTFRRRRDGEAKGLKARLADDFAGVCGVCISIFIPFRRSMVIDQINVGDVSVLECEHQAPISRYRHRPLSFALAFKG